MEGSQEEFGNVSFTWTDDLAKRLIELLLEYRTRTQGQAPFKWDDLVVEFGNKTGTKCTKKSMKNKYSSMKREYSAWKTLRNNETGLGWDPINRRVIADNAWWNKKIKEKKECAKFRHKGMDPEWQDLFERLFGGMVATGHLAMSPSMNPSRVPNPSIVRANSKGLEEDNPADEPINPLGSENPPQDLGYGEGGADDFFHQFNNYLNRECGTAPLGSNTTQDQPAIQTAPSSQGVSDAPHSAGPNVGTPPCTGSSSSNTRPTTNKRHRQSAGATMLSSHLSQSRAKSDRMMELLEGEATSIAHAMASSPPGIEKGLEAIKKITQAGLLMENSMLWCLAVVLNKNDKHRQTFLALDSDENRLALLNFEQGNCPRVD